MVCCISCISPNISHFPCVSWLRWWICPALLSM